MNLLTCTDLYLFLQFKRILYYLKRIISLTYENSSLYISSCNTSVSVFFNQ